MLDPDLITEIKLLNLAPGVYDYYDPGCDIAITMSVQDTDNLRLATINPGNVLATTLDNLSKVLVQENMPTIDAAISVRLDEVSYLITILLINHPYKNVEPIAQTASADTTISADTDKSVDTTAQTDTDKSVESPADNNKANNAKPRRQRLS